MVVSEHEHGNGACLFTRDGEAARYFYNVDAGMLNNASSGSGLISQFWWLEAFFVWRPVHTGQTECVFTQEGKRFSSVGHPRPTKLRASLSLR